MGARRSPLREIGTRRYRCGPLIVESRYHHAMKCIFVAGLLASLSVSLMRASDDSITRLSLRGVKAFDVVVEAIDENAFGLTRDDLQTDVELRCRQAGIKLEKVTAPYLYINVTPLEVKYADGRLNVYAVNVEIKFEQVVLLERAPAIRMAAPTWSAGKMVTSPSRDFRRFCLESVQDTVDKFLNALRY